MTTIIKLLVAALFLNAVVQVTRVAYKSYNFEDSVHEALLFAPSAPDADIIQQMKELADEQEVPLDAANIQISHAGGEVRVQASYDEDIKLVPGVFTKSWTFNPSTSARVIAGVARPSTPRPR